MAVAPTVTTLSDFLQLDEEKPALEFDEKGITHKVSPKGRHSALQRALLALLAPVGSGPDAVLAFPELRSTYGGCSYVPDVSVYRRDRVPRDENGNVADDFTEPPDIAIEIASPEQSVNGLVRRCLWYVSHGVTVALLIDPRDESVLAFHAGRVTDVWRKDDLIDITEVVPAFSATAAALFDALKQ